MARITSLVRLEDFVTGKRLDDNLDVAYLPRVGELMKLADGRVGVVQEICHVVGKGVVVRVAEAG